MRSDWYHPNAKSLDENWKRPTQTKELLSHSLWCKKRLDICKLWIWVNNGFEKQQPGRLVVWTTYYRLIPGWQALFLSWCLYQGRASSFRGTLALHIFLSGQSVCHFPWFLPLISGLWKYEQFLDCRFVCVHLLTMVPSTRQYTQKHVNIEDTSYTMLSAFIWRIFGMD